MADPIRPPSPDPKILCLAARAALRDGSFSARDFAAAGWSPWADEFERSRPTHSGNSGRAFQPALTYLLLRDPNAAKALGGLLDSFPDFLWAFSPAKGFGIRGSGRSGWRPSLAAWTGGWDSALSEIASRAPEGFFRLPTEDLSEAELAFCAFGSPQSENSRARPFYGLFQSPYWGALEASRPLEASELAASLACSSLLEAASAERRRDARLRSASSGASLPESDLHFAEMLLGVLETALSWAEAGYAKARSIPGAEAFGRCPKADGALRAALREGAARTARACLTLDSPIRGGSLTPSARALRESIWRQNPPKALSNFELLSRESAQAPWRLAFCLSPSPECRRVGAELLGDFPRRADLALAPALIRPFAGLERAREALLASGAPEAQARLGLERLESFRARSLQTLSFLPGLPPELVAAALGERSDPEGGQGLPKAHRKAYARAIRGLPFTVGGSVSASLGSLALAAGALPSSVAETLPAERLGEAFAHAELLLGKRLGLPPAERALVESAALREISPEAPTRGRKMSL